MTLKEFIKENRKELDKYIKAIAPNANISDQERRLWILNNEGLYLLARSKGVKI